MGINFDHTILVWNRLFFTLALLWVFCLSKKLSFFLINIGKYVALMKFEVKNQSHFWLACVAGISKKHAQGTKLRANEKNKEQGREASKGNLFSPPPPHFSPVFCSTQARSVACLLVWSLRQEKERKQLLRRLFLVSCGHVLAPCTNCRGLKCAIDVWLRFETRKITDIHLT